MKPSGASYYHAAWYRHNRASHLAKCALNKARQRAANREFVYAYLREHPCVDCGESEIVVLEFDHVRGKKLGDIARLIYLPVSTTTLASEIAKCALRQNWSVGQDSHLRPLG